MEGLGQGHLELLLSPLVFQGTDRTFVIAAEASRSMKPGVCKVSSYGEKRGEKRALLHQVCLKERNLAIPAGDGECA